jgi:hypothetical protein
MRLMRSNSLDGGTIVSPAKALAVIRSATIASIVDDPASYTAVLSARRTSFLSKLRKLVLNPVAKGIAHIRMADAKRDILCVVARQ